MAVVSHSRNYIHLICQARNILIKLFFSILDLLKRDQHRKDNTAYIVHNHDHDHVVENNLATSASAEAQNSAFLVPLPFHCIAESVKNQLPVVQYRDFLAKTGRAEAEAEAEEEAEEEEEEMCIVCMNIMEGRQGVRELCNCSHAFHKECLDVWIDRGHITCPLCRSNLLPKITCTPKHDHRHHDLQENITAFGGLGDPWRAERMIYLFGEDYLIS